MIEIAAYIMKALLGGGSSTQIQGRTDFRRYVPGRTMKMIKPKFGKQWEGRTGRKTLRQGQTLTIPSTPSNGGNRNLPLRRGQEFEY